MCLLDDQSFVVVIVCFAACCKKGAAYAALIIIFMLLIVSAFRIDIFDQSTLSVAFDTDDIASLGYGQLFEGQECIVA